MTNKILIGLLVILIIFSGLLGFYSHTLSKEVNVLSERLTTVQEELTDFREESISRSGALAKDIIGTSARISALEVEIDGAATRLGTLDDKLGGSLTRIATLEGDLSDTLASVGSLDDEIKNVAGRIAEAMISADSIYQGASQSVVRISNGEQVIGSGFIIDTDAHVLTAYHVIENLTEINTILPDGSFSAAAIVGTCKRSDVAVLLLEKPPGAEPLAFADSDSARIGEPVVAIGNPFDLTETLTSGIISQLNRLAEIDFTSETRGVGNLIQFDALVNFGNSGCPVLNSRGDVIGMAIARIDPVDGDGICYAISSNKLKRVTASLIEQGSFDYPWVGISISDITPHLAQSIGRETINGVLVGQVAAEGPANTAGLKVNDIIMAIDGVAIRDVAAFISYLGEKSRPKDMATLTVIRDSVELELSLKVGKWSP